MAAAGRDVMSRPPYSSVGRCISDAVAMRQSAKAGYAHRLRTCEQSLTIRQRDHMNIPDPIRLY